MTALTVAWICDTMHEGLEYSFLSGWGKSRGFRRKLVYSQLTLFALFQEPVSICVSLMNGILAYHSPSVSPTGLLTSQGGFSFHCWTPRLGHPVWGFNCWLPRDNLSTHVISLFLSSPLLGTYVPTWLLLSLLTQFSVALCIALVVQDSASLQLVFSENYKCIFDMFMVGGLSFTSSYSVVLIWFCALFFKHNSIAHLIV